MVFSTYLTSVVGNLLTKLPQADTLRGMNLYTGLFASSLALTGYFFCTRKLKMPKPVVFLGEMAALSLCWCPTASLYNYLTYVLFLFSVIFLYLGLVRDKKGYLVCAGVLLGSNVLVRFSNLPEAAMIVAVWAYDIILWLEDRKRGNRAEKVWLEGRKGGNRAEKARPEGRKGGNEAEKVWPEERKGGTGWTSAEKTLPGNSSSGQAEQDELRKAVIESGGERGAERGAAGEGFWHRTIRHTLWCLVGYAAALAFLLSYIHICYGIQEYAAGIQRLFAMTDRAADYKPSAMIMGIVGAYVENLYWVVRIGGILAGGMVLFAAAGWLEELLLRFQGQKGTKRLPQPPGRFLWRQGFLGCHLRRGALAAVSEGLLFLPVPRPDFRQVSRAGLSGAGGAVRRSGGECQDAAYGGQGSVGRGLRFHGLVAVSGRFLFLPVLQL